MVQNYSIVIDRDLTKEEYSTLISFVSEEKREGLDRYFYFRDAMRSLLGELLAKLAIIERTNLNIHHIHLEKNEYGKPLLTGIQDLHFNISHSGNLVVCALDEEPVGIDVEEIRSIDVNIAKQFFHQEEYNYLFSKPEEEWLTYFYMFWTAKESYIKAKGKGLSIPLNTFVVTFEKEEGVIKTFIDKKEYAIFVDHIHSKYICAICTKQNKVQPSIQLKTSNFYQHFMTVIHSFSEVHS